MEDEAAIDKSGKKVATPGDSPVRPIDQTPVRIPHGKRRYGNVRPGKFVHPSPTIEKRSLEFTQLFEDGYFQVGCDSFQEERRQFQVGLETFEEYEESSFLVGAELPLCLRPRILVIIKGNEAKQVSFRNRESEKQMIEMLLLMPATVKLSVNQLVQFSHSLRVKNGFLWTQPGRRKTKWTSEESHSQAVISSMKPANSLILYIFLNILYLNSWAITKLTSSVPTTSASIWDRESYMIVTLWSLLTNQEDGIGPIFPGSSHSRMNLLSCRNVLIGHLMMIRMMKMFPFVDMKLDVLILIIKTLTVFYTIRDWQCIAENLYSDKYICYITIPAKYVILVSSVKHRSCRGSKHLLNRPTYSHCNGIEPNCSNSADKHFEVIVDHIGSSSYSFTSIMKYCNACDVSWMNIKGVNSCTNDSRKEEDNRGVFSYENLQVTESNVQILSENVLTYKGITFESYTLKPRTEITLSARSGVNHLLRAKAQFKNQIMERAKSAMEAAKTKWWSVIGWRSEEWDRWDSFLHSDKMSRRHKRKEIGILGFRLQLILLILAFLIARGSATCPRLCSCKWKGGKQTVECINKGLTSIPSDIDPGTQVLDLTGNPLVIISKEKFKIIGLTNLQRIYATRCKLVQLDDTAFRGLSNLVELDLSINELRVIPAPSLQYLPSLMRLQLSFNPITHIKDGSFRGLGYLTSLELTACSIQSLEPLAFQGLDRLEWLKINDNNLTTIPSNVMLPKSLHGVDIHNNPWTCDCKLRQLRNWLVQYNVPSSIEPKCTRPLRLRNRTIKSVLPDDLACAPSIKPATLFIDVVEGKNVSFECQVAAMPDADIKWHFNGYPLMNSTFIYDDATSLYVYEEKDLNIDKISYLRIETVTEAHSGLFQCIAENLAGRAVSNFTLRVSSRPTKPPKQGVPSVNRVVYVGGALIALAVLVIILCCVLAIRCCRRHSTNKSTMSISSSSHDKQINSDRQKSTRMPKYIQMGTPAPKVNGIIPENPPISVIENSPYRTEPIGSTDINPDLIADGPDDRIKPAKKKVIIAGVEEMDANGIRTTRKLDDILEENEDTPFDSNCSKMQNGGYNHYPKYSVQQMETRTNKFAVCDLLPEQVPQINVRYYNPLDFPVEYDLAGDHWSERKRKDGSKRYSPVPAEHPAVYATLRRNQHESHSKNYFEEYTLKEQQIHFRSDNQYPQNYPIVPQTGTETGDSFCECCQPTSSAGLPIGRVRGDGCSFDHLISSCGAQCCYNEKTGRPLFDNSLPNNYRPLETSPPPPPPAGYGDSEDEVDPPPENGGNWDDGSLSPGTRVLRSPDESEIINGRRNGNDAITNV